MRRTWVLLAGIALLSTGVACQHTAGKCDCELLFPHCTKYGLFTPDTFVEPGPPRGELMPPPPPPRVIGASAIASDIGEPIRISPSAGAF